MNRFIIAAVLFAAIAMAKADAPGVALFSGFLSEHPEIKAQFPKFKNVANADLASNADLIAHAGKIAKIIDSLPTKTNWDDIDALSAQHKALGVTNKAYYEAFRAYFFKINNFGAADAAKWNAAFDKFFSHFFSAF